MRVANFIATAVQNETTPELNFGYTMWLPLVAGAEQDPMATLTAGGAIQFNEAGFYLITANFGGEVTLPNYASDQWAEVFGVLDIGVAGGTGG